jgi:hypothetical protein
VSNHKRIPSIAAPKPRWDSTRRVIIEDPDEPDNVWRMTRRQARKLARLQAKEEP